MLIELLSLVAGVVWIWSATFWSITKVIGSVVACMRVESDGTMAVVIGVSRRRWYESRKDGANGDSYYLVLSAIWSDCIAI